MARARCDTLRGALKALFSLIAVVFISSTLAPRAARAAAPQADALVNQAVELRRSGDDEGALALLLQAYGLARAPRTAGQLGFCEQALGRWAEAETHLTEALKAGDDPWVKKNRDTIEKALGFVKSHIARIEILGDPATAEVWVNGALAGKLPLGSPVRVAAGEVEIELRAPGFVSEKKTMRLEAGQYQRIILHASERPAPPAPAPPAAAHSETTNIVVNVPESHTGTAATPTPAVTKEPEAAPSSGRLALKWVAWGIGAAALGVGFYGAAGNSSGVSSFDKKCGIDPKTGMVFSQAPPTTDAACASLKSDYESKSHLGIGGFVAAGVLAATGVVLWLAEPATRAHDATALRCAPALGERLALTLGCAMRF
jgi:hypothetical protein